TVDRIPFLAFASDRSGIERNPVLRFAPRGASFRAATLAAWRRAAAAARPRTISPAQRAIEAQESGSSPGLAPLCLGPPPKWPHNSWALKRRGPRRDNLFARHVPNHNRRVGAGGNQSRAVRGESQRVDMERMAAKRLKDFAAGQIHDRDVWRKGLAKGES